MWVRKTKYTRYNDDSGGGFVALLEFVERRGQPPEFYVLYRYSTNKPKPEMIECQTRKAAEKLFPYGWGATWQSTSRLLHRVAGVFSPAGSSPWIRIGKRPRPSKTPKFRWVFGRASHILRIRIQERDPILKKIQAIDSEINFLLDDDGGPCLTMESVDIKDLLSEKSLLQEDFRKVIASASMVCPLLSSAPSLWRH